MPGLKRCETPDAGLGDDREVGRLLELEQEDAGADGVRRARRDEDRITRSHDVLDERAEQRVCGLALDPVAQLVGADRLAEAGPDARRRAVAHAEDQPRLGLAKRRVQKPCCRLASRVAMDRQPLARVEQLDQEAERQTRLLELSRADERSRLLPQDVEERERTAADRHGAQPEVGRWPSGRCPGPGRGADPVLRTVVIGGVSVAAKSAELPAAAIEARDAVGRQPNRLAQRIGQVSHGVRR